jgi:hypothetical protein
MTTSHPLQGARTQDVVVRGLDTSGTTRLHEISIDDRLIDTRHDCTLVMS